MTVSALDSSLGKSVPDFCRQRPSDVEAYTTTLAELETGVDRMDDLFSQFETGRRDFSAAKREQDRILEAIHHEFLLPISARRAQRRRAVTTRN
jgi:hypothetical protein